VAGYNIYRAATAAGPFSKINTELITGTVYVDAGIGVGIAAGGGGGSGSYYVVTSVDSGGTESVQSLAVKPASAASSAAGGVACFIESVSESMPQQSICFFVLLIIGIALCYRRQASGIRR
jgi:hypothetical protein